MDNKNAQEEISMKELFGLFLKLWNKVVQLFLKAVLFVIKHAIPLILLIAIGLGVAYFYKDANPRYKRVFIISATEYSGEFLTREFGEINAKFARNNDEIKKSMSLEGMDLSDIQYSVKPIFDKGSGMDREEFQYLNYIIENRLIEKEDLNRMIELSNYSYEVEVIYPVEVDGLKVFEATLDYLRENEYAADLHRAILNDIEMQLEENKKLVQALGEYVESLAKEGKHATSDAKTMVVEGARGSDLGAMMYARTETQKITNKLSARKVQLEQNFRVLNHGNAVNFYGRGIMSKKILVYPFLLVSAYLFIIFVIYIIRAALALKEELKREEG
ncbi:MAG TPA: hypothetical protein VKX30_06230 [Flavobacteriaceae bacterium]|nr:hypothetical protein [Flavobacteriaceae bacterium]